MARMPEPPSAPGPVADASVQFFAVASAGPLPLPVPPTARSVHELFDPLPLGVYSALRTFGHERFLELEAHFERTDRSAELLGWSERLDRGALRRALHQAVRAYPGRDACVRFDLLAAPARSLGSAERTLLALSPLVPVPEAYLREGVGVRVSPLRRPTPLVKTARFVVDRRPYPLGRQEAYEHLILDEHERILEGTSSNFVALLGRRLHFSGDEALQGITQRVVARLAGELGLECVRAPIARADLARLDEAFLTGSTRGIVPIAAVEGTRIGSGAPGPWTGRITHAYREHAARAARPAIEE